MSEIQKKKLEKKEKRWEIIYNQIRIQIKYGSIKKKSYFVSSNQENKKRERNLNVLLIQLQKNHLKSDKKRERSFFDAWVHFLYMYNSFVSLMIFISDLSSLSLSLSSNLFCFTGCLFKKKMKVHSHLFFSIDLMFMMMIYLLVDIVGIWRALLPLTGKLLTLPSPPSIELAPEYDNEDCFCMRRNLSSISLFWSAIMACSWLGNRVSWFWTVTSLSSTSRKRASRLLWFELSSQTVSYTFVCVLAKSTSVFTLSFSFLWSSFTLRRLWMACKNFLWCVLTRAGFIVVTSFVYL